MLWKVCTQPIRQIVIIPIRLEEKHSSMGMSIDKSRKNNVIFQFDIVDCAVFSWKNLEKSKQTLITSLSTRSIMAPLSITIDVFFRIDLGGTMGMIHLGWRTKSTTRFYNTMHRMQHTMKKLFLCHCILLNQVIDNMKMIDGASMV